MAVLEAAETLTDDQLRERLVDWLRENLPPQWVEAIEEGDDEKLRSARELVDFNDWCARLGEAGWATPTWPAELGFLGLSGSQAKVVNEELNRWKVPRSFNIIGIGMGGPTIMHWGTDDQKQRLLKPMAKHEEIWCQLFSEPGS
ncbi:MAG: acyl-CoA dehydrogenase family protein, partial [Acidimicrobiia bacterium]|nr:acyl-CoA dehydrogenase family protein [Acidimicrobiia bacterium]